MGLAIAILIISATYALFLLFRVKSIFGTYFLIVSGNNLFNAEGIELSIGGLVFLWLIAIIGIVGGILLLVKKMQFREVNNGTDSDTKICPKCAETIKLEAKICKHCSNEFADDEIEKLKAEKAELKKFNSRRREHHWSDDDSTHDIESKCPTCGDLFYGSEYTECTKCNCELVKI